MVEKAGRFGCTYEFAIGKAKAANTVRFANQGWGFKHNRFESQEPDWYIIAVHWWRASYHRDDAPECRHEQHGESGHTCEAFAALEEIAPSELPVDLSAQSANGSPGAHDTDGFDIEVPDSSDSEPESYPDLPIETEAPQPATTSTPLNPGDGLEAARNALRELGLKDLRDTSAFVHVHVTAKFVDTMVLTHLEGDMPLRLMRERNRALGGAAGVTKANPRDVLAPLNIARHLIAVRPLSVAASDIIKDKWPAGPARFTRHAPEFPDWQEAWHEAFRDGKVLQACKDLDYKLVRVETMVGSSPRPTLNEHGEQLWFVEELPKQKRLEVGS